MAHGRGLMILSWSLGGIAAVILLQTLFFKFTAAKESVYIFRTLGLEPWGRIGTGMVELIAAILLLVPSTDAAGIVFKQLESRRVQQPEYPPNGPSTAEPSDFGIGIGVKVGPERQHEVDGNAAIDACRSE